MTRIATLALAAILLAGCTEAPPRYQLVSTPSGALVRMDTKSGEMRVYAFGKNGKSPVDENRLSIHDVTYAGAR